MTAYMLDTNAVSHLLRRHPQVTQNVISKPMPDLCISAITEGELLFGMARRPEARTLHRAATEFLRRVSILPWDRSAASCYGRGQIYKKLEERSRRLTYSLPRTPSASPPSSFRTTKFSRA